MNKSNRIIVLVIAAVLVLCACAAVTVFATGLWTFSRVAYVAEQTVSDSPQKAVRVGEEIADYEIPDRFSSPVSVHVGDMTMLRYASQDELSYILLAQFPVGTSVNTQKILELMDEGSGDPHSIWHNTDMTVIEQLPVTIRGEETTLSLSEGTTAEGVPYRMATANFRGRGGPALVMIATPLAEWDMEMVEDFIATIQ